MKHLIALILSLFAISAQAQSTELAPQHPCYLNNRLSYDECWSAPNYPALNKAVSVTNVTTTAPDGSVLIDSTFHIQSRTAGIGGAKSTAPKVSPLKAKWTARTQLASGTYRFKAQVTAVCTNATASNEPTDQAVILNVGPISTVTPWQQFTSGVPKDFDFTVKYDRVYAYDSVYFTFGLNTNPPKASDGKDQFGCKYSLTNLSLTTAALIQQ